MVPSIYCFSVVYSAKYTHIRCSCRCSIDDMELCCCHCLLIISHFRPCTINFQFKCHKQSAEQAADFSDGIILMDAPLSLNPDFAQRILLSTKHKIWELNLFHHISFFHRMWMYEIWIWFLININSVIDCVQTHFNCLGNFNTNILK